MSKTIKPWKPTGELTWSQFEREKTERIAALCEALKTASDVEPMRRFMGEGSPPPPTPYKQILALLNHVMASEYQAPPQIA